MNLLANPKGTSTHTHMHTQNQTEIVGSMFGGQSARNDGNLVNLAAYIHWKSIPSANKCKHLYSYTIYIYKNTHKHLRTHTPRRAHQRVGLEMRFRGRTAQRSRERCTRNGAIDSRWRFPISHQTPINSAQHNYTSIYGCLQLRIWWHSPFATGERPPVAFYYVRFIEIGSLRLLVRVYIYIYMLIILLRLRSIGRHWLFREWRHLCAKYFLVLPNVFWLGVAQMVYDNYCAADCENATKFSMFFVVCCCWV